MLLPPFIIYSKKLEFCEKWIQKEPENVVAATAGVYAFIDSKEYHKAETLADRFIMDKSKCFEEYDDYVEEYFLNPDFDEEDDDELPFN